MYLHASPCISLTHVLFWAGIVRQAPGSDRFGTSFNMLLSTQCLNHLQTRGALTATELDALLSLKGVPRRGVPPGATLLYDIELLGINGDNSLR